MLSLRGKHNEYDGSEDRKVILRDSAGRLLLQTKEPQYG